MSYSPVFLRVDLDREEISQYSIPEDAARRYLGGRGLGAYLLYSHTPPNVDPLSPEAWTIIATGPLTNTLIPGASRTILVGKSPLTGLFGDSDFGGWLGTYMKAWGWDGVILTGRAQSPVWLRIDERGAELVAAHDMWGKTVGESSELMKGETRGRSSVACIGQAGANLVRYACVVSDGLYVAGRLGLGAVWGSKNFKGISVAAVRRPIRNDRLDDIARRVMADAKTNPATPVLAKYGTWVATGGAYRSGVMPVHNFTRSEFADIDRIDGDAFLPMQKGTKTCFACPVACRRNTPLEGMPDCYGGPQYETVASLGSLLDIGDPKAIIKGHIIANAWGLDTISLGMSIAFLLEAVDLGIISESQVGFRPKWGDPDTLFRLTEQIAFRQGIGDLLAEGVKIAHERTGAPDELALHVKGLELPMHDPRGKRGVGLSYATNPKGADHMESFHDEAFQNPGVFPALGLVDPVSRHSFDGKATLVRLSQDYWGALGDSLTLCKTLFSPGRPVTPEILVEAVNAATGWTLILDDLLQMGASINTLCRLYNLREGASPSDDRLPVRLEQPMSDGSCKGESVSHPGFASALDEYYRQRDWPDGVPSERLVAKLGL